MGSKIIEILSAALTPVIAMLAVYIAYQQYRTNRDKFKLDLYEKRFEIYMALIRVLSHVLQEGKFSLEKLPEFREKTREASFFFGKEITDYLERIDSNLVHLWGKREEWKDLPAGEERSKLVHEDAELLKWLVHQLGECKKHFQKYLKIG